MPRFKVRVENKEHLYFLSKDNMNDKTLYPKIPENYFTKNGYEDDITKRVCFTNSIEKSLMAISMRMKDMILYVHVPKTTNIKTYKPTSKQVPDCKITGETWVTHPIGLKCIGKIKVIDDAGKEGHKFKYGDKEAALYDWTWEWVEKYKDNINENTIMSDKDFSNNLAKWIDGDYPVLLITGLSGGGKSTLANQLAKQYKADIVELDQLEYDHNNSKNDFIKKFMESDSKYKQYNHISEYWEDEKGNTDKDKLINTIKDYIHFCVSYALKNNIKVIIEGIQIYQLMYTKEDLIYMTDKPIIIIGTSPLISKLRQFKRIIDGGNGGQSLKTLIQDNNYLDEFRRDIKSTIKESYNPINYSDKFSDVIDIVNSLSDVEKYYIAPNGPFKKSPYCIYRKVYKNEKDNMGFIELYSFKDKSKAYIVLAVSPKYRGKGLSKIMVNDAINSLSNKKGLNKIIWGAVKKNTLSNKLAEELNFKLFDSDDIDNEYEFILDKSLNESIDRIKYNKYTYSEDFKDIKDVINSLSDEERKELAPNGPFKDTPDTCIYKKVYKNGKDNAGFIYIDSYENKAKAYIGIAISPKYRGKGLSKIMVNDAIDCLSYKKIKKLIWTSIKDNIPSNKTAIKLGFKKIDTYKIYNTYSLTLKSQNESIVKENDDMGVMFNIKSNMISIHDDDLNIIEEEYILESGVEDVYRKYSDTIFNIQRKIYTSEKNKEKIERDQEIDKAYKYTDRLLPAAYSVTFKRMFQMQKNLILHPFTFKSYDLLEKDLLDLVQKSKSQEELKFLRRDAYAGKSQMKFLSSRLRKDGEIEKAKQAEKHLKWIEDVYQKAITERLKKIKDPIEEAFLLESTLYKKKYKCIYCENRMFRQDLVGHILDDHEDFIPQDFTATRLVFNLVNKKEKGTCVICGKETPWDENKAKYDRFCCEKCVQEYIKQRNESMMRTHKKLYVTDDPEFQKKMLAKRKISGEYIWSDGVKRSYTGTYEKKLLEFLDKVMGFKSVDVISPGETILYEYQGENHSWILDQGIVPYDLQIDVKDGGDNPNNRQMPEYREKQLAKERAIFEQKKYNYLRLTNNNFSQLLTTLAQIKMNLLDNNNDKIWNINEYMSMSGVNPVISRTADSKPVSYIVPCMVQNTFVEPLYSRDEFLEKLYRIIDGKLVLVNKSAMKKQFDISRKLLKSSEASKMKQSIDELITKEQFVDHNMMYEMLTGHKLLDKNQYFFDESLSIELEGFYKAEIRNSITIATFANLFNENKISICESAHNIRYKKLSIQRDINGFFAYNEDTKKRTKSYEIINEIPDEMLELLDDDDFLDVEDEIDELCM